MTAATRPVAFLDVESVPCPDAVCQTNRHARGGHGRTALHRLVATTILTAIEGRRGFSGVEIRTFAHPRHAETDMLGYVDLLLPDPADVTSKLVTYNGGHDLRLLRHRACALWMFDLPSLSGWCGDASGRMVDLMAEPLGERLDPWSLPDVCAALGLPIRRGLSGRTVARLHAEGHHGAVAEHNRLDVIGTFIAYAHRRSFEEGDDAFAATAWAGVGNAMEGVASCDPNVQSLSSHHLVALSRSRITGPRPSAP